MNFGFTYDTITLGFIFECEVIYMDFLKLAAERYSVRKFEQKHLEKEVIDKILKAAHLAPTGCNYQPQRILVLNTDASDFTSSRKSTLPSAVK